MSNEDSELDQILNDHFEEARKAELPAGSWARIAARPETVSNSPARSNVRRRMWFAAAVAALIVSAGAVAIVNAGDDDQSVRTANSPTSVPQASFPGGPSSTTTKPAALAEFCAVAVPPEGERPEAFGEYELIAEIERLRDVSPSEIRADVDVYLDFIARGGLNPAGPFPNPDEYFPADVQNAIRRLMTFVGGNCQGQRAAAADMPSQLAAIVDSDGDGLGDVLLIDTATGGVVKTIYEAPPPNEVAGQGASGAVNVDVGPDGAVYYETCCEQAKSLVNRYDPTTGESSELGNGEHPKVSPDGKLLAVINQTIGFVIYELGDPGGARGRLPGLRDPSRIFTNLAWSPDGATLAVESLRYDQSGKQFLGVGLDLVDVETFAVTSVATNRGPYGLAMPVFLPDGRLLIATNASQAGADGGPISATSFGFYNLNEQRIEEPFELSKTAELDGSANGLWVIATQSDGSIQVVRGPNGLVDPPVRIPLKVSGITRPAARAAW